MHHTDPEHVPAITYLWVLAWSGIGGLASFLHRVRQGEIKHGIMLEMITDTTYSAFAGLTAFYWCQNQNYDPMLSAIIIGISGHMGARAIIMIEQGIAKRLLGNDVEKDS